MTGAALGRADPAALLPLAIVVVGAAQTVMLGPSGRTLVATVPFVVAAAAVVIVRWTASGDVGGRRWLLGVAAVNVIVALTAIAAFLRALPAGLDDPAGFYRVKVLVTTPVGDHNTVAGLLLVGVVATAVLAAEDRRWLAGVAVTTFGVVAGMSRGAAAILVVVGLGAFVLAARRRVAVILLAAGAVALAGVLVTAALLGASPPGDGAPSAGPFGASIVARADLVSRGVEVATDRPLLGVGLGAFGDAAADLPPPNDHAHNAIAHLAAEAGITGATVALALPLLLLVRAWRLPAGWRRELTLLAGVGLIAHAQVDVLAGLLGYEFLLAVLVGTAGGGASEEGA